MACKIKIHYNIEVLSVFPYILWDCLWCRRGRRYEYFNYQHFFRKYNSKKIKINQSLINWMIYMFLFVFW